MAVYGRLQEQGFLRTGNLQFLQQLQLLFDQAALLPGREHGIKQDQVRRLFHPRKSVQAAAPVQTHPADCFRQLRKTGSPFQGIRQKFGDDRIVLIQIHLESGRGQDQGILSQTGCGVDRSRDSFYSLQSGSLYQKFILQVGLPQPWKHPGEIPPDRQSLLILQAQPLPVPDQKQVKLCFTGVPPIVDQGQDQPSGKLRRPFHRFGLSRQNCDSIF